MPRGVRRLEQMELTAKRAAIVIAAFTVVTATVGAIVARLLDPHDFVSIGSALWWSLQTVTTVGYGDIVPRTVAGRVIGAIIMLAGIGFLAVVTAAVTAALIESARRSLGGPSAPELGDLLTQISARLDTIDKKLDALDERTRE